VSEPLGKLEDSEVPERVLDRVEALDEALGSRAERSQGRARPERREPTARVQEERPALAVS